MGQIAYAASYIRANMPIGADHENPVLNVQEAWDVAAFMIVHPRPVAPARQPVAQMVIEELPIPAPPEAGFLTVSLTGLVGSVLPPVIPISMHVRRCD